MTVGLYGKPKARKFGNAMSLGQWGVANKTGMAAAKKQTSKVKSEREPLVNGHTTQQTNWSRLCWKPGVKKEHMRIATMVRKLR